VEIIRNTILPVLIILLAAHSSAYAKSDDDYELGKKMFDQGQYEQSLEYFKRSELQGLRSISLYYNLGSVYYKLKQYKQSQFYFEKTVSDKKTRALAYYNLALISHKNGNNTRAITLFRESIKLTKNKKLVQLAKKQISTVKASRKNNWHSYVSATYGDNSNIASTPDNGAANQPSKFITINANVNWLLSGTKTRGFNTHANIYNNNFTNSDLYDFDRIAIGIDYHNKAADWKMTYDVDASKSTYGTFDYQRITAITINSRKKTKNNNQWRLRYKYEDIKSLNTLYDYLDGWRQKIRTEYRIKSSADEIRLQHELELNDRANTAAINYSPVRNRFIINYIKKLTGVDKAGMSALYRNSDYDATPARDREDNRLQFTASYTRKLDKNWSLKTQASHRKNNSTVPTLEYDRTILSISLSHYYR